MGHGRDRARRLSLGAAVTFAIAAVAGVVGGRLTGHITLALVVFSGLVVAGMLVSYWVDRGVRANSTADGEEIRRLSSSGPHAVQNITASAPHATAQGAVFGNVINHGDPSRADFPEEPPREDVLGVEGNDQS